MLNLYLRYFDLQRTGEVVERLKESLQDAPIDFENVYLVVGDFTGLVDGASEIEGTSANIHQLTNGTKRTANGTAKKMQWSVDGEEETENGDKNGQDTERSVEDILNDFQYTQLFPVGTTSFVDLAHAKEIDDGLNVSHAPPKNIKKSSCNILCRDKMPVITDPFREAIYRTKSPLDLRKMTPPAVKAGLRKQSSWRTEKLTGHCNVIREGLCHMAIPREWTWGGPASDHCPVWIECYKRAEKEVQGGLVPAGAAVISLSEAMNGLKLPPMSPVANGTAVRVNGKQKRLSSSSSVAGETPAEPVLRPVQ